MTYSVFGISYDLAEGFFCSMFGSTNTSSQTAAIPVIAVDGPSASGKGTLAKRLAAHFSFAHLDTGLLYRAVGLIVLEAGGDPSDGAIACKAAASLSPALIMDGSNVDVLREDRVSIAASKVAANPGVRDALLKFQQDFCLSPPSKAPGVVLDGRDIGTVIAPAAPVKLYVTASTEVRAQRRFKELQGRGGNDTYSVVLADMEARDARDANRATAPAKPAPDAIMIDTTVMTADEAFTKAVAIAESKLTKLMSS